LDDPASQAQLASRNYPDPESRGYEVQEIFYRKNVMTLMSHGARLRASKRGWSTAYTRTCRTPRTRAWGQARPM
jgi:hypothetical protein